MRVCSRSVTALVSALVFAFALAFTQRAEFVRGEEPALYAVGACVCPAGNVRLELPESPIDRTPRSLGTPLFLRTPRRQAWRPGVGGGVLRVLRSNRIWRAGGRRRIPRLRDDQDDP